MRPSRWTLSGAVNASVADNQGVGTITNDDQVPDISVDDQVAAEGNSLGTTTMTFNVTLVQPERPDRDGRLRDQRWHGHHRRWRLCHGIRDGHVQLGSRRQRPSTSR